MSVLLKLPRSVAKCFCQKFFGSAITNEGGEVFIKIRTVLDVDGCMNHFMDDQTGQVAITSAKHAAQDRIRKPAQRAPPTGIANTNIPVITLQRLPFLDGLFTIKVSLVRHRTYYWKLPSLLF